MVRKWNEKDGVYVDVDVGIDGKKAENGEIAFTFKRIRNFDQGDRGKEESEIDLEAEGLRNLVKEIIGKDYPGQNLEGETVNIIAPYAPLASCSKISFHSRNLMNFRYTIGKSSRRHQRPSKAKKMRGSKPEKVS